MFCPRFQPPTWSCRTMEYVHVQWGMSRYNTTIRTYHNHGINLAESWKGWAEKNGKLWPWKFHDLATFTFLIVRWASHWYSRISYGWCGSAKQKKKGWLLSRFEHQEFKKIGDTGSSSNSTFLIAYTELGFTAYMRNRAVSTPPGVGTLESKERTNSFHI